MQSYKLIIIRVIILIDKDTLSRLCFLQMRSDEAPRFLNGMRVI